MNASRPRPARGVAIVPVLLCFVLILLISGGLLNVGLAQRVQLDAAARQLQTVWLVESGLERAAAKLAGSDRYEGETWTPSAEEMAGPAPGLVTIRIENVASAPRKRRVTVQAEYPRGTDLRSRQRKQMIVDLGPETEGGSR